MTTAKSFDICEILKLLPHRYPFLLVDRVLLIDEESMKLTAVKNVTFNEPFFPGHFPGMPTMPGVLQLEAPAQAAGPLAVHNSGFRPRARLVLNFAGLDHSTSTSPPVTGHHLLYQTTAPK